jgi:hypothetical protein
MENGSFGEVEVSVQSLERGQQSQACIGNRRGITFRFADYPRMLKR